MNVQPSPARARREGSSSLTNTGRVTPLLVAAFCVVVLLAALAHVRGRFHIIRTSVLPPLPVSTPSGPGGQQAVVLTRTATTGSTQPEFVSATLLPGRGANLLQLVASVPGRGQVPVLASPSVDDAGHLFSGTGGDVNGGASTEVGAALLAPWAGYLVGTSTSTPGLLQASWDDRRLSFPASGADSTRSLAGLLLNRPSDSAGKTSSSDAVSSRIQFQAGSFNGNWPSSTDMVVDANLASTSFELTATAHNSGSASMPFGIGWLPHFAIPAGARNQMLLRIPSSSAVSVDGAGRPTGQFHSVAGSATDFSRAGGIPVTAAGLDITYNDLQSGVMGDGPLAEIRFPNQGYGIRLTPLTENTKGLRVLLPPGGNWIVLAPMTNFDDPFGSEWKGVANAGLAVVAPGEQLVWRVRVEIFPLNP